MVDVPHENDDILVEQKPVAVLQGKCRHMERSAISGVDGEHLFLCGEETGADDVVLRLERRQGDLGISGHVEAQRGDSVGTQDFSRGLQFADDEARKNDT